jgi:gamma-glutamylputrescine oxidase
MSASPQGPGPGRDAPDADGAPARDPPGSSSPQHASPEHGAGTLAAGRGARQVAADEMTAGDIAADDIASDEGFNGGLGAAASYYAATANPFAPAPELIGAIDADVCVVGGGVTGLSAALHARARGFSVVLVEGGRIGWGASGRNGGQMIPGLRQSAVTLIARYGATRARMLFDLALEARALTHELIETHKIACDLRDTGHLTLAARPGDVEDMAREAEALAGVMKYSRARVMSGTETHHEIGSPLYHGALLDEGGGHLHPLNYALGLADAARAAGVQIFERSPVAARARDAGVRATPRGTGFHAQTPRGAVSARYGVLACDSRIGDVDARFSGVVMPVANYICVTAPVREARLLIARDRAVSDSRFVVNYFRLTPDGRMLFGGGERYSPRPPSDIASFVRRHMARVFPRLATAPIDYAWGGMVSITRTRLPHIGRRGETFFAHGYSGQGVLLSALAGKLIAEAMAGTAERFDVFASLDPQPFPGGAALRDPLYVLGMAYYALRDRL